MDFTRQIYWNVGSNWSTLAPMYLLVFCSLLIFLKGCYDRFAIYKQGKPLNRFNRAEIRLKESFKAIFLQSKVKRSTTGVVHALVFWSFICLFLGTLLIFLQADLLTPFFDYILLKGTFYKIYSLVLDISGFVALTGLLVFWALRKNQLKDFKTVAVFLLLFTILITGFLVEGCRIAVTEPDRSMNIWSPVGALMAKLFVSPDNTVLTVHKALWWLHLILAFSFISLIPFTSLRHLLTASANSYFTNLGAKGKPHTIDLEDESIELYGASTIHDLSWKDVLDSDACTSCERCQNKCPAWVTGKPLSPMELINQIGTAAFENRAQDLIEAVGKDALWACTSCRACEEACPASIEHVTKVIEMRRHLVLMEGEFAGPELQQVMEQVEVNGNPFGKGFAGRGDWAKQLGIQPLAEESDIDILYFTGCYGAFDSRSIDVSKSFIEICQAAGVKVGILGKEEKCCGEPIRKLGNEYMYQQLAAENIEKIKSYKVQKIVTTCPHCYNTLNSDYRDLGFDIEVVHHTVFIEELISSGRLKIDKDEFKCTYHDACYLSRYNDMSTVPRQLISKAGGQISEMSQCGSDSFCCGGGGGRIFTEEKLGTRINSSRASQAAETGAALLITSCPFCLNMLGDGIKNIGEDDNLQVRDLAEIVADKLIDKKT